MSKTLENVLEDIERKEGSVKQFYSGYEMVDIALNEIQKNDHDRIIHFPYPILNQTLKAIFPTSFMVIGADTGCGKSELLGHIAYHASIQKKKVVYFDFENDEGDFVMRQICKIVGSRLGKEFSVADLRLMDLETDKNADLVAEVAGKVADNIKDIRIFKNEDLPTVESFVEILEGLEDVDLVCVDHLHYFNFEASTETQSIQISKIMRALRMLTKKRIPIIVASHLKERTGKDKTPSNYSLFGSSNIAKEAKSVVLIHREEDETIFQITKNRDGRKCALLTARFNPITHEFIFNT